MRKLSVGEFIAIASLVVAGLVWAVRVEGRVDKQQTQIESIKQEHKDAIELLRDDVAYIRGRIDRALEDQR